MRKKLRRDKRDRVRVEVAERARETNLVLAAAFSVGTALVYCGWAAIQDEPVEIVGLLLSAAAPPVLYGIGVYVRARWRAPVLAYGRYRAESEGRSRPTQWQASHQLIPDDMGVRIALRLHLSRQYTAAEAAIVTCVFVPDPKTAYVTIPIKDPFLNRRFTNGAAASPDTGPVEVVYPDDFEKPPWPLQEGSYHALWTVADAEGASWSIGDDIKIRRRRR